MPRPSDALPKDLTLAEFRQFRDYIHQHSGIYIEESKRDSLRVSLVTRATRIGSESWDLYFETLSHDEAEFKELMSLITINETSFFRFPGQFEALRTHVLPEICNERTSDAREVRIWSAGCSTGEEPYSIAMTWADSGLEPLGWKGEVLGTDVSPKALARAKSALYPARSLLNVPDDVVRRHFAEVDDSSYRIAPHVRRYCDFDYHNLIKEPYPLGLMGNWDVIFCRNVTIYFRLESTRRVVHNFYSALNEGGYLFIGHSETLSSISDEFESVEIDGIFLYRKPRRRRLQAVPMVTRRSDRQPLETPGSRHARDASRTPAGGASDTRGAEREASAGTAARRHARTRPEIAPAAPKAEEPPQPEQERVPQTSAAAHELLQAGRTQDALLMAEQLLSKDPYDAEAHVVVAHIRADSGEYDRALAECQKALAINPLLPGARYILGLIHQRQGDLVRAVSEFKKTVYIDADFAIAHMSLGNLYKGQGRFGEAARAYENALRALYKDPEGDWTLYLGGWKADVVLKTCERSLLECRKATGSAS